MISYQMIKPRRNASMDDDTEKIQDNVKQNFDE